MAEDLLPLVGHNFGQGDEDSSDSDFDFDAHEDPDAEPDSHDEEEEEQIMDKILKGLKNKKDKPEKKKPSAPNVTFDKCLPGAHTYLGNDLEDVRGRTVHDAEERLRLPIHALAGVVLVPGQTLPLHLFNPAAVAMVRRLLDGDKTFGMVTMRYLSGGHTSTLASIGTTAEILAVKEETDDGTGITTVRVKAVGRQRFEIIDTQRQIDGILTASVRILPERELPPPLEGATPASYTRVLGSKVTPSGLDMDCSGDHLAVLQSWLKTNTGGRGINRFTSANFTWWPPWVYKQYDARHCMELVRRELTSWNESLSTASLPEEPSEFSFWVMGNLPLDDGLKLHLLRLDSAVQRLRCTLSIMRKCTVLCCKECGLLVAHKNDVFSMAVEGPMGAYVNPGGHVHETLTVYKAQGLNLIGRPSTQHSWFPGYAWTIVQCRHCNLHLGWKFTDANRKLRPEKFWGLCRSSLLPGLQNDEEGTENWLPTQ